MKYYLIAGEASGDLHGSNLIKELQKVDKTADFCAWGGDLMEEAGAKIQKHYKDLAFMGFVEVLMNIRTILKNFKICKKNILHYQPDALILIDYPGFNLRMAKWAKAKGLKVYYYISPTVWAWKENRVETIRNNVDRMFTILPFEKQFYKDRDFEVDFVGHPLLDHIENYVPKDLPEVPSEKRIVALLPGSRKQEISTILPTLLELSRQKENLHFVIAMAPGQDEKYYKSFIPQDLRNVSLVRNRTYDLFSKAEVAIVTSGTATLETGLFKVPQVVVYKTSAISYAIAKRLVNVKYISLVNLILDKGLVRELIQEEFTLANCKIELENLLDTKRQETLKLEYEHLHEVLGKAGASKTTANLIYKYLT